MEMLLALDVATTRWTLKTMFVARVERTCACGTRFCGNQLLRSDLRGCNGWTLLTCKLRSGLQASFIRLAFILVVTMLRGLKLRCIYGLLFQQFRKTPYTLETTSLLPTMVASGLTSASISTMFASPLLAVEGTCICGKLLGYQESFGYKGWRLLMCKSRLLWIVVCLQASFVCFDFRACCHYAAGPGNQTDASMVCFSNICRQARSTLETTSLVPTMVAAQTVDQCTLVVRSHL